MQTTSTIDLFKRDVLADLKEKPKKLNSKYFYDATGDLIFQKIMNCSDYYPTRCETEVLKKYAMEISLMFADQPLGFDMIELGAGDATKTKYLLKELGRLGCRFSYLPIDISASIVNQLENELPQHFPGIDIKGFNGEYLQMLQKANRYSTRKKVILFLGGNIGNMVPDEAAGFLNQVRALLQPGDQILIGFDLKKNPDTVLKAYRDSEGITSAFNLNLLERINRELNGNFDVSQFEHYASYDPVTGACKSYLMSKSNQSVNIAGEKFVFKKHEPIWMEISQKYNTTDIDELAKDTGFKVIANFLDDREWFTDSIWEVPAP